MNATGTKTAASTSVIVTIGAVISAIAALTAWIGRSPRSRYFSTFSTTMIASSTTRPIARTSPQSVSVLIEKPNAAIIANVATSDDRDRQHRDDRRPHPLEEHEDDEQDQQERLEQRLLDLDDVLADILGRVVDDPVLEARGEALGEPVHALADLADDVERIGVGVLVDRHRAGRLAVEPAGGVVVLRVELDPGDVPRAGRSSRRRGGGR